MEDQLYSANFGIGYYLEDVNPENIPAPYQSLDEYFDAEVVGKFRLLCTGDEEENDTDYIVVLDEPFHNALIPFDLNQQKSALDMELARHDILKINSTFGCVGGLYIQSIPSHLVDIEI